MRIFLLLTIIVFIFLPNVTTGQTFSISGKVTDTNNIPIEFAAVALFKDSVYISSAISDGDGLYHLYNLHKGKYKISFSYLGFLKYDTIIDAVGNIQLNHRLINENKSLNEVTVRFRRPTIERKSDRLIFNIENSIFNIGLDALEAISKAPSVRVNNNSISIVGKSKVSVMLDDKLIHPAQWTILIVNVQYD